MSLAVDSQGQASMLVSRLRALTTALVSDILDSMHYRSQVMDYRIAPLGQGAKVAGRAFPMRTSVVYTKQDAHYDALFDSYDHMAADDVIVIAADGDETAGIWGELLSIGAMAQGVRGIVIDGHTRDPDEIAEHGFACLPGERRPLIRMADSMSPPSTPLCGVEGSWSRPTTSRSATGSGLFRSPPPSPRR